MEFFFPTLIIFLLTQENTGISLAGLGFIYLFHKECRKQGLAFIFGGIGVSLLAAKITSLMSPTGYEYIPHISLNPINIFINYFNSQEKIENWKFSLVSFSFLPLLSPGAILAVFLDLSQYFITGKDLSRMWSAYTHHRAMLAPFFTIGLVESLIFLKNKKININYLMSFALIMTFVSQYYFHFPLNKLVKKDYWKSESWMDDDKKLIGTIPRDVSVAASQNLVSHLSHRNEIYILWPKQSRKANCNMENCWWLDFAGTPEYMMVDLHPNQWITQLLESNENFGNAVANMEKDNRIKLVRQIGYARLYKINN